MLLFIILTSSAAFISTLMGGWLALRLTRAVGLVIAFGAGIRIGAAFFELIPESIEHLSNSIDVAMIFVAAGFLGFYMIEKITALHVGHETAAELDHTEDSHRHVGLIGIAGMSVHSFFDGVALAAALLAGGSIGLIISMVLIVHRFSDGIGISSLLLASAMSPDRARIWLGAVALAPVGGILLALVLPLTNSILGAMLGVFAGFFLYIGAAELLPEAHRKARSRCVVWATLGGVGAIYLFSLLSHSLLPH